jgi:hypothetical protein
VSELIYCNIFLGTMNARRRRQVHMKRPRIGVISRRTSRHRNVWYSVCCVASSAVTYDMPYFLTYRMLQHDARTYGISYVTAERENIWYFVPLSFCRNARYTGRFDCRGSKKNKAKCMAYRIFIINVSPLLLLLLFGGDKHTIR